MRPAGAVIGFMSGNQQEPDIMCEVFILAPTDLVDDHEFPDRHVVDRAERDAPLVTCG